MTAFATWFFLAILFMFIATIVIYYRWLIGIALATAAAVIGAVFAVNYFGVGEYVNTGGGVLIMGFLAASFVYGGWILIWMAWKAWRFVRARMDA
jgi:hypothetical protein